MQYLEDLSSLNFDLKYFLILFNFVTIAALLVYRKLNPTPVGQKHPVLLLIAHPDDECMFFQPTIKNLRGNHVIHLLCMSGDEGRRKELGRACGRLGVKHWQCVSHERVRDGMKEKWDEEVIRDHALKYIHEHKIKALITFDNRGVSSHPNHISLNSALSKLITKQKTEHSIKLYQLSTVNILRKYWGLLDFPISLLAPYMFVNFNIIDQYRNLSEHHSQFVWYRKLFILFSRYAIINTYDKCRFIEVGQGGEEAGTGK